MDELSRGVFVANVDDCCSVAFTIITMLLPHAIAVLFLTASLQPCNSSEASGTRGREMMIELFYVAVANIQVQADVLLHLRRPQGLENRERLPTPEHNNYYYYFACSRWHQPA